MEGSEDRAPGRGTPAVALRAGAQSTDPEVSLQPAGGPTLSLFSTDTCPLEPTGAGILVVAKGRGGVWRAPDPRCLQVPEGRTALPGGAEEGGPGDPSAQPLGPAGLGKAFLFGVKKPFLVPINDLSSFLLTGSLQLGWH